MMTKDESTKHVNFMTPGDRGSCAWVWPYKSYCEYALSSTLSKYSTLIAIV